MHVCGGFVIPFVYSTKWWHNFKIHLDILKNIYCHVSVLIALLPTLRKILSLSPWVNSAKATNQSSSRHSYLVLHWQMLLFYLMLALFGYFSILEIGYEMHLQRSKTSSHELKWVDVCRGDMTSYFDIRTSSWCAQYCYTTLLWFKPSYQASPVQPLTRAPVGWGRELR